MKKKRFVVDLGSVEIDQKSLERVEAQIQKAALSALAEIDFRGDLVARFPREWLGLWIDVRGELDIIDKEIVQFAGR